MLPSPFFPLPYLPWQSPFPSLLTLTAGQCTYGRNYSFYPCYSSFPSSAALSIGKPKGNSGNWPPAIPFFSPSLLEKVSPRMPGAWRGRKKKSFCFPPECSIHAFIFQSIIEEQTPLPTLSYLQPWNKELSPINRSALAFFQSVKPQSKK